LGFNITKLDGECIILALLLRKKIESIKDITRLQDMSTHIVAKKYCPYYLYVITVRTCLGDYKRIYKKYIKRYKNEKKGGKSKLFNPC